MTTAQRTAAIDALINNSCGCWSASDRQILNGFTNDRLTKLIANTEKTAILEGVFNALYEEFPEVGDLTVNEMPSFIKDKMNGKKDDEAADDEEDSEDGGDDEEAEGEDPEEETKTKNCSGDDMKTTKNRQMTDEEWLASAPRNVREIIKNSAKVLKTERDGLITKLTANCSANDKARLTSTYQRIDIDDLRVMAKTAPVANGENDDFLSAIVNYQGASGGPANNESTNNEDDNDDVLLPAVLNCRSKTA